MSTQSKKEKKVFAKKGGRLMGIDYGKKKIGVALTDSACQMSFPKYVLQNDDKILEKIEKIITENEVQKVIIGKSIDYNMNPNPIMTEIRGFRRKLESKFGLKTDYQEEFLTTQEALRIQGQTELTDASAAALILKSYLEKESN